jgi:hypothetical protein
MNAAVAPNGCRLPKGAALAALLLDKVIKFTYCSLA